jgi:hypothetical protein
MPSVKPVPVIVTVVPPAIGPTDGLTPVTVGAGALTVMLYVLLTVPPRESVAVTVNVSVPVAVGVPVMFKVFVPLAGTIRPATAFWMLLTVNVLFPVPPPAVIVWT